LFNSADISLMMFDFVMLLVLFASALS